MPAISPTQSNIQAAFKSFLAAVLPVGTKIVAGQVNRVPEPKASNFVVVTPIRFTRLRTNVDTSQDCTFDGSIDAGNVLTVGTLLTGLVQIGATVFAVGLDDGVVIDSQISGIPGGAGTYKLAAATPSLSTRVMAAGTKSIEQGAMCTVQLDFHSADFSAGDMAQLVSTLFRDSYGVKQFAEQNPNYGVVPLYADDPRQAPFLNDQQQYEWRWTLDAQVQVNQVVVVDQQYAGSLEVDVISVDAEYPPS